MGIKVINFEIEPSDLPYYMLLESNLSEWNSPEDDEAFRDLWFFAVKKELRVPPNFLQVISHVIYL